MRPRGLENAPEERFSIIDAGDGNAATDLLRSRKDEIDVILLDMTLPGMSSHEVIAEAQRIRPDVKVILTTAYSREMAAPSFAAPQVKAFIRKPISNQRSDEPAAGNSIRVRLM